jgi:hypothetical protein
MLPTARGPTRACAPILQSESRPHPKSPFGVYIVETNVRAWKTGSQIDAEQRFSVATAFPKTHWNWVVLMDSDQETDTYSQLDERLHYFYGAIYMWWDHFVESCLPRVGVSCSQTLLSYDLAVEAGVRRQRVTIAAITNEPLVRLIVMERSINLFIRRAMGEFVE